MPDETVSTNIDDFMSAADQTAMRAALDFQGTSTFTAISAAGNTNLTPAPGVRTVIGSILAGGAPYTAKLVILGTPTPADGDTLRLALTFAASANPTIEIRDGTPSGTLLATLANATGTVQLVVTDFVFSGGWTLVTSTQSGGGSGGGDAISALVNPSVSITGTTTLSASAFSKTHNCSGTSTNYTVTLPDPTSHFGEHIELVMDPALTKLVTVDAGSGKTIDGQRTRILWASEVARLRAVSATAWTKIAGKTIPLSCLISLGTAQNIPNSTATAVLYDTATLDNSGQMADVANNRINILRPSSYTYAMFAELEASFTATRCLSILTAGVLNFLNEVSAVSGLFPRFSSTATTLLAAGDTVSGQIFQNSGSTQSAGVAPNNALSITEIPSW